MNKMLALLFLLSTALLSPLTFAGEVNVNLADAAEIAAELKGVGLKKAAAIVEYREQHGKFEHIDDLAKVKGIGIRLLDLNRENIRLKKSRGD